MVHVPVMFLSEWREFSSAPYLAGKKKTGSQCFLSASVTRKILEICT
jgi:hypothetical protein